MKKLSFFKALFYLSAPAAFIACTGSFKDRNVVTEVTEASSTVTSGSSSNSDNSSSSSGETASTGATTVTPPVASTGSSSSSGSNSNSSVGVQAVSSNVFLNSLGVNTHISQFYDYTAYMSRLTYLGVRNIRDGYLPDPYYYNQMYAKAGVKINMISDTNIENTKTVAKALAATGALLSLEGPNEPNNWPITYNGQVGGGTGSWLPVAYFMRDMYASLKADSVLKNYPFFHLSEGGGQADNAGLQFLEIPAGANTLMPTGTKYSDYANLHNYVEYTTLGDNQAWNAADPQLNGQWDGMYAEYSVTWRNHYQGYTVAQLPNVPRVTTETGWNSANGGEHLQGVLMTNVYLSQYKRGYPYTFIYQVRDGEGGAGTQGLYNNDWTPKLAATYIHNMTTILADTKTVAAPAKVNYSIANQPATVHDLLLQNSNGKYHLVVWGERVSGSDSVMIQLGSNYSSVKVYDITSGTTAIQNLSNISSLTLSLSDHAMIVELN